MCNVIARSNLREYKAEKGQEKEIRRTRGYCFKKGSSKGLRTRLKYMDEQCGKEGDQHA